MRASSSEARQSVAINTTAANTSEVLWVEALEPRLALSGLGLLGPVVSALPPILADVQVDTGITVETPVASVSVDTGLSTAGVDLGVDVDTGLADLEAEVEAVFAAAAEDPALIDAGAAASLLGGAVGTDVGASLGAGLPLTQPTTLLASVPELVTGTLGGATLDAGLDVDLSAPLGSTLGSTLNGVLAIPTQTLGAVSPALGGVVEQVGGQVVGGLANTLDRASGTVVSPLTTIVDNVLDHAVETLLPDGQLEILDNLAAQLVGENIALPGLQLDLDLGLAPGWTPSDPLPQLELPLDPGGLPSTPSEGDGLEGPAPIFNDFTGEAGAGGGLLAVSLEADDAPGEEAEDEVIGQAGDDELAGQLVDETAVETQTGAAEQVAASETAETSAAFSERGMSLVMAVGLSGANLTDAMAQLSELAAMAGVEDLTAFEASLAQFLGEMSELGADLAALGAGLLPWMLAAVGAALAALEVVRRERKARLERQAASLATIA